VGIEVGPVARLVPVWVGVVVGVVALVRRWPAVLCLGVVVLAGALAQRSLDGLTSVPVGPVRDEVTLLTDPASTSGGGVRADVRLGERRLALVAQQAAATSLEPRLAGERVVVLGEVGPPGPYERRMLHRHLSGRLRVTAVVGWRAGHGFTRAANGFRRTLERGAESLPERQRSLLMGLTLGDDRQQPPDLVASFRAAGLTHLTAVSGQNISFVLALAAPVLMRVRFGPRLVLTLGLLAGFALVTRAEPSVLRATAMAAVVAYGAAVGRPVSSLRALGLGVTALLLCDPLLVTSLGFQLSALATLAIVVGATPLARRLPGPRWLALPLAVTVAAQLGVAPLLIATFGPISLASVPANLLAVPAAGPVMVWGLTGGLVAGVVGEPLATLIQVPTRLLLAWIEGVASVAARLPFGQIGLWQWGALAAGTAVVLGCATGRARQPAGDDGWSAWRPGLAAAGRLGGTVGVAVVMASAVLSPGQASRTTDGSSSGPGLQLWRSGGATLAVIDGRATDAALDSAVHAAAPSRLDVLVVRTDAARAVDVAAAARERWPRLVVLMPRAVAEHVPGGTTPPAGSVVDVGGLRVRFGETAESLTTTVEVLTE
jgi:competence protein ComEC